MNRQTTLFLPFALVGAVLLWLVWKNWPKSNPRQDEVDKLLEQFKATDESRAAEIKDLTTQVAELTATLDAQTPPPADA